MFVVDVRYAEADLIPCEADEPREEQQRRAIRRALMYVHVVTSWRSPRDWVIQYSVHVALLRP